MAPFTPIEPECTAPLMLEEKFWLAAFAHCLRQFAGCICIRTKKSVSPRGRKIDPSTIIIILVCRPRSSSSCVSFVGLSNAFVFGWACELFACKKKIRESNVHLLCARPRVWKGRGRKLQPGPSPVPWPRKGTFCRSFINSGIVGSSVTPERHVLKIHLLFFCKGVHLTEGCAINQLQ